MSPVVVLVAALGLVACGQEEEGPVASGESFTLRVEESAAVEDAGLEIRFEDVLRDSRCPPDVHCIRAGEAVVVLTVSSAKTPATRLEVDVPPGGGAETTLADHRIRIVSLEPPASSTRRLDREEYVLTLVIE